MVAVCAELRAGAVSASAPVAEGVLGVGVGVVSAGTGLLCGPRCQLAKSTKERLKCLSLLL